MSVFTFIDNIQCQRMRIINGRLIAIARSDSWRIIQQQYLRRNYREKQYYYNVGGHRYTHEMLKYVAQAVINVPLSRSPCDFSDPSHVSGRSTVKDNESLKKERGEEVKLRSRRKEVCYSSRVKTATL